MEYSNSQMNEIIEEYIHDERHRQLMKRRMIDNITIERLAEEQEMSVSQVKRIIKRNMGIVFRHLPKAD